jgi:hypothetical protein
LEHFFGPACIERELVIGDGQGAALELRQVLQHNNRNFAHALRPGRSEARFTSDEPAVRPNENWIYEAEFPDGGGDLSHLLGGVRPGVTAAQDQPVNRPALNLDFEIPHKFARQAFWVLTLPRFDFLASGASSGGLVSESSRVTVLPQLAHTIREQFCPMLVRESRNLT